MKNRARGRPTPTGVFVFLMCRSGSYELELKVSRSETTFEKLIEIKPDKPVSEGVRLIVEACSGDEPPNISLTDEDKAKIAWQMLKPVLEKHSDLFMKEQRRSKLILSTENTESRRLTAEDREKFNLMKQAEVHYRADTRSDFLYLRFSKFNVKGKCVEMTLGNIWAVGKNSGMVYLSGGGHAYEFRRVEGRRVGKLFNSRVS